MNKKISNFEYKLVMDLSKRKLELNKMMDNNIISKEYYNLLVKTIDDALKTIYNKNINK